ncbi:MULTISPECIES: LUD domain-containing protein [unclassified Caballeronia]|uniref:lactate utilization protein B n=1 Tax=unclassified Caballeronia TaxID=2646786 RepID=UPI0028622468|nr:MULTISPECIES: LUD domain-containing protein [unclassified Caballeronia]MDR5814053.1 LUD domain-containing protein [Caballeronia sp. LZ033]MDR5878594.1 LUD domain-containing protein [Caballeronia sp. LZ032]
MSKTIRIDHAKAASAFLQKPDHVAFHDKRLWDLRTKRDAQAHGIAEWETMRDLASGIKEHTLSHLADYLAQFADQAEKNGVTVHFAANAQEHNELVYQLMSERGMTALVKSKSMLTDECYMRDYLEPRGITVMETDLGERIQQLDHQDPSHMVVPAVHKLRADVAELFGRTIGTDPANSDIHYLAESQRMNTRPYFVREKTAGMTGCNFAVAETGTVVVCTNEGNADLSANVPPLHIASIGIEKIIPTIADLGVFVRMLSRSALGSPITQYTSHFRQPRPGTEMHFILVDNGRSERLAMDDFWFSLKCIRCGACMNTCPVYRRSGGLSYGGTYSGPIGAIINPTHDLKRYSALPFASTMNGSCTNVCPVKVNIHEQIYKWREVIAEKHEVPFVKQEVLKMAGRLLASPTLYRASVASLGGALKRLPNFVLYNPLNIWGRQRELPEAPAETFHEWYRKNRKPAK